MVPHSGGPACTVPVPSPSPVPPPASSDPPPQARTDLPGAGLAPAPAPALANNPWDYLAAQGKVEEPVEHQIQARPQLTVIEPVIKNPYLTKLKRLLPTYLEDLQDEQAVGRMAAVLGEVTKEQANL